MIGAEMLVQALHKEGVEFVWGYPGGSVLFIYDEIFKQDKFEHILVRHEQAAVHAADGYARATGLMKQLYKYRNVGDVIVFDDADAIFYDDVSLNILKAATDSSSKRMISWMSEAKFEDDDGDIIPKRFEFKGTIVFITNLDFDAMIDRGHKLAPHLAALVSRAHYIDLAMKTKRDYYVRIKQVVKQGMLADAGFTSSEEADIMQFVEKNFNNLRETSLRSVIKIAALRRSNPNRFESLARITCCRNVA
jgi:hypothetical protein